MNKILSGVDGFGNDHLEINRQILANRTILLEGDYHCSSKIIVPYAGVNGARRCIVSNGASIYANTANQVLLHWADCWGQITGHLNLHANNNGVHLMHLTPELEEKNLLIANQNYNYFQSINFIGGDEQLVIMAGKPIGASDSGCWYNEFGKTIHTSGKRAIWIKDNGTTLFQRGSGSNSNLFGSTIINGSCNTGIQIDAGGGNQFKNLNMENIQLGTAPNATPTGIIVKDNMLNQGANPDNYFNCHLENVTRHCEIYNAKTKIHGDVDWNLSTGSQVITRADGSKYGICDENQIIKNWLATISCDVGSLGLSYKSCSAIKRGKQVTISGYVQVNSLNNSPSGRVFIGNLPFKVKAGLENQVAVSLFFNNQAAVPYPVMGRIQEGASRIELAEFGSVGGFAQKLVQYSDFSFSCSYITD